MLPEYDALGLVRERSGNSHVAVAPSNIYPTRDGRWIAIGANANSLFRRFASAIGRPELADDPRYRGNRERTEHGADIVADEQVRARGVVRHLEDDAGNRVATTAPVPRFRAHPTVSRHAARAVGADTRAVLDELGIGGAS